MIVGVPLVNGVSYAHADIVINLFGVPVIGVTAISYKDPQDITPNYSTGTKPTSVGFGPVHPEAAITLTMEAVQQIQNLALKVKGAKIQNIPFFDVGINFLPESGILVRHCLRKCRFKGRSIDSATGNSMIEETLELFVADIDYAA